MNKNIEKYKKNKGYNSNNKVFKETKPIIENHDNEVGCFFEDKNDKGYTKAIITITHPRTLSKMCAVSVTAMEKINKIIKEDHE